ncbi:MAG: AI-2E family transporter [Actinobacteria bacterium]|nr:AI-2E family transporter [Actinomycetota bacterium]
MAEPTPEVVEPTEPPVTKVVVQRSRRLAIDFGHPFAWGFTATVGALVALALASSVVNLSTVLISVGVALFIALALDPLVRWLERHRMSRGLSIAVVFAGFFLAFGGILAVVLPTAIAQISQFAAAMPGYLTDMQNSDWFKNLVALSGQSDVFANLVNQARTWLSDPTNLLAIGGGALAVGTGVVNAISGTLIVLVLTLYFLASLNTMKLALERLAPAYARPQLAEITDQITESVGGYVSGMAILAFCNAVFALILMSILSVPFAALLAFLALLITMIPMVGPVLFWLLASAVICFTSPISALIFAVIYFAYMQVEAYIMTPRVMNKAVDIPGSLVLIGAMVGGTLLGLLGALIAVPVTASLLMIVNKVFIPKQDAKLVPDA